MNSTIKKKIELKKNEIALRSVEDLIAKLDEELKTSEKEIDELNDEDLVEEKFKKLEEIENDKNDLLKQFEELQELIKNAKEDLENEEKETKKEKEKVEVRSNDFIIGGKNMNLRAKVNELIKREADKNFFEAIYETVQNKRAIENISVPQNTLTVLAEIVSKKSRLYDYVDVRKLAGDASITIVTVKPEAAWGANCSPLHEGGEVEKVNVTLNSNKLSSLVFVCNAVLEDSVAGTAEYILNSIAEAVADKLDDGILNGKGASANEPEGILAAVTETKEITGLLDIVSEAGLIGYETNLAPEKVIAVVNRKTLYSRILKETFGKDAAGLYTLGVRNNNGKITLPDGTEVIECKGIADDEVLVGDFKAGYVLGERIGITLKKDESVHFVQDETAFAARARFDGKVKNKDAFVRLKYKDLPEA